MSTNLLRKTEKDTSRRDNYIPSKIISISDFEAAPETEIAAEISLPEEGGWGWIVVAASFMCIFILDGVFFTFGTLYKDITEDMKADISLVALINSIAIALYFIAGPIISALINRFGFRSCTMTGSIIVSFSYLISYFAGNYIVLLIFYGVIPGFGGCFIYMASQLIVGFYFERLRALAMAIAGLGQSFGITVMNTANTQLVTLVGWRTTTLLHSGMFGLVYFIAMAYRPLLSLTVTQTEEDSRTATYLPSLSTLSLKGADGRRQRDSDTVGPSASERLFSAPSNSNFPTVADVLEESQGVESEHSEYAGPSSEPAPAYTITARSPTGGVSKGRLRTYQDKQIEMTLNNVQLPKHRKKWWSRLCHWRKHIHQSRPMYRDDAFYSGTIQKLPAYKRSRRDLSSQKRTGLEYRMAVSRTVTAMDLKESKGLFTTAVRRTLATMMNPKLLSRKSFLMVCTTGFLIHVGLMVPYVFLPDRNKNAGIDKNHCNVFVSVIGFSNAVGRLIAGVLVYKYNQPVRIYSTACLAAGVGVIASTLSYSVYFQYFCCIMFGISAAHISTLRSVVIVDLYGLENLTNATGILLMFQGFGSLLGTPLSSILKNYFGYFVAFIVAGAFMIAGGLVVIRVKTVAVKEVEAKIKRYVIGRRWSTTKRIDNRKLDIKRKFSSESDTIINETFHEDSDTAIISEPEQNR